MMELSTLCGTRIAQVSILSFGSFHVRQCLIVRDGFCNAVIFWMDYDFDEDVRMSTGLIQVDVYVSSLNY